MKNNSTVSRAVRHALILGVAATPFAAIQAHAEDASAENVERIQVTGSRINRTDIETASPVTVISSDFISQSGFNSVEEVLNSQPAIAGMNLGANSNNGSGGSATVNLRGMGTARTLVLLNGRRMVASGTGADSSVDLNTIPVAMIKSIEILKDGASAIYGSDAIAGVVNIITHKDYEGTEIKVDGSIAGQGDGETGAISVLHGLELAGGNLVLGAQYSQRGEVIQSDRDWVPEGRSSTIPGGTLGGKKAVDGTFVDRTSEDAYDYTTTSYAQTPNKLFSAFASYNKELTDSIELSADAMFTRRDSHQQMAPQPAIMNLETAKLDPKYADQFKDEDGNVPEKLEYKRRMTDAGPRIFEQETNTYRASLGLKGYLDNDDTWDLSLTYGRNDSKDRVQNSINKTTMMADIYANQDLWFSGNEIDRQHLVDNDVIYTEENEGGNEQFILAGGYSGVIADDIGYALGAEYRNESGFYTPDMIVQNGDSTSAQQAPTDGDYTVKSAFAEISAPITEKLSVDGAVRYDHYSTFGGKATWKLGATYQVTDTFMLRSVAATGFRAPNVSELYGGNTGSYDYLSNPWNPNSDDKQLFVNYTSDENLQPESSQSFTLGAVIEVADNVSTTIDYFNFTIEDAITRLDVQDRLDACFGGNEAACKEINVTPDGDISGMTSALTNVGELKNEGIDWNITYTDDIFKVTLDTTYLINFEKDSIDYTGTIDGNNGGYSKLKSNLTIFANVTEDLSVRYNANFVQGMVGDAWGDAFKTDDVLYHNVSASYHINDAWNVNGGIKNLFDTDPQVVPNGNDMNTVPSIYDVVGRTFFISTSYKF